ncbi:PepSY domain-containing protein [Terriglobus sp. TAA 43]|uniref:PepSY-associated TM helix domain-containing protein n=1 Tax=Terriglobus sp. TAA 43 TaxID=278961 RepID=UPI00064807A0|nr:PepSY-associated TM helix domain-containing protein [Terriglobus sp. TAA 43]
MGFASNLVHHPRKLWLRRALFQVHLWLGVLLSLYVIVIGFSGSVLVWEDELQARAFRGQSYDAAHVLPASQIVKTVANAYPKEPLYYLMWPQENTPVYTAYLHTENKGQHIVRLNATTGEIVPIRGGFIDWVHDLHIYLLMGQTGFIVNCVMGIGLLVLSISGVVLWWPGLRAWARGFYMNLRAGWKRINFDAHNAIGIWTLLIVSWWGFTAIAFLLPAQVMKAVSVISPVKAMRQPDVPKPQHVGAAVTLQTIADRSNQLNPSAFLSGVSPPDAPGQNYVVYMDSLAPGDFSHRFIHTFAADGQLLSTWHYGEKQSLGDWILWLVYPLHFGTLWGTWVKVIWSALGMSLPILSITGLLMYWNRYLGKRWKKLQQ